MHLEKLTGFCLHLILRPLLEGDQKLHVSEPRGNVRTVWGHTKCPPSAPLSLSVLSVI